MTHQTVPGSLKTWLIILFIADVPIAIPLLISPQGFLQLLGWHSIDPFASRIVAAALFGIGIVSLPSRNSSAETYRNLLSPKIIWSGAAVIGIALSIYQSTYKTTLLECLFLFTFLVFHLVWQYWRYRIRKFFL